MDILQGFVLRKWLTISIRKTAQETYIQTRIRLKFIVNAIQINKKNLHFHRAIGETLKIPEKLWLVLRLNFIYPGILVERTLNTKKEFASFVGVHVDNCTQNELIAVHWLV